MSSHFKKNFIRMSAMNENEFDQNSGQVAGKSIGSPSSPSSLSSASSTTSNHSSSSSSQQSAAIQAAVQALLSQQSMGLHTQHQSVEKSSTMAAMQQQQQLNTLLASIAAAQQQGAANPSTNALLNSLMQQQMDANHNKKSQKLPKLNVKTNHSQKPRAQKGNSVSPPGTSSSCSDDQEVHSPSDMNVCESDKTETTHQERHNIKQENDQEYDLDRSTNSSASQDLQNQTESQENLEDELDDYETSFQDSKRHRNHSGSSPTRSTSSNPHSRSTSPSTTSYHDSPAAFPLLNPLDSATAMLGGLNCTPGAFDSPVAAMTESIRKRRPVAGDSNKKIKPVPADKKDDAYWERRRKNNEAAKRSRDLRRQKEDDIAVKATVLEQENLKLKAQVTILKAELSKLHFMLYNR